MGFPPDALPSTSLPLGGINFLGEKKSLPASSVLTVQSFCTTRVSGLLLGAGGEGPPDLGDGDGEEGAWGQQEAQLLPRNPHLPPTSRHPASFVIEEAGRAHRAPEIAICLPHLQALNEIVQRFPDRAECSNSK